jgi:hypothetical protein
MASAPALPSSLSLPAAPLSVSMPLPPIRVLASSLPVSVRPMDLAGRLNMKSKLVRSTKSTFESVIEAPESKRITVSAPTCVARASTSSKPEISVTAVRSIVSPLVPPGPKSVILSAPSEKTNKSSPAPPVRMSFPAPPTRILFIALPENVPPEPVHTLKFSTFAGSAQFE